MLCVRSVSFKICYRSWHHIFGCLRMRLGFLRLNNGYNPLALIDKGSIGEGGTPGALSQKLDKRLVDVSGSSDHRSAHFETCFKIKENGYLEGNSLWVFVCGVMGPRRPLERQAPTEERPVFIIYCTAESLKSPSRVLRKHFVIRNSCAFMCSAAWPSSKSP